MPRASTQNSDHVIQDISPKLKVLNPHQIRQIDQALASLGDCGEVRLIKNKGELRFITKVEDEEVIED
jgi:hypothetical protein